MCRMEMTKSLLTNCSRSVDATGSTERDCVESIHKRQPMRTAVRIPLRYILKMRKKKEKVI